ncbi:unnamed protein product [Prorocentrum cordatum]|uniref:Charged multivesicular body protein 5 n=1 Tax=Prorocentrum cordatum TaxID=2364126 RepID=A0ABN9YD16_9DINO|nr:unnamed protein product [Polarella glacialis]
MWRAGCWGHRCSWRGSGDATERNSACQTGRAPGQEKIAKCDEDIKRYMQGRPPQKSLAVQTLKRKKMYMQQRDQLLGTQFNVECLAGAQEQAELTVMNVEAMRAGQADLKERYAQLGGVGNIEKLMDQMAGAAVRQDINEAMSTSYAVPDGFDEASLEEEFGALEEEMKMEQLAGLSKPSYLAPAAAAAPAPMPAAADPEPIPASAPSA